MREGKRKRSRRMEIDEEETGPRKYMKKRQYRLLEKKKREMSRGLDWQVKVMPWCRGRGSAECMREARKEWNPRNDSKTIDVQGKTKVTSSHGISLLTDMKNNVLLI